MNQYEIKYSLDCMPEGYVGKSTKWAHSEKAALKHLLKKAPDKSGICVFKRGMIGRIISIERKESK
jgi:hypothetical protein